MISKEGLALSFNWIRCFNRFLIICFMFLCLKAWKTSSRALHFLHSLFVTMPFISSNYFLLNNCFNLSKHFIHTKQTKRHVSTWGCKRQFQQLKGCVFTFTESAQIHLKMQNWTKTIIKCINWYSPTVLIKIEEISVEKFTWSMC